MTNEELTTKYITLDERVTRNDEKIKTLFTQGEERSKLLQSLQTLAVNVELLAHEQKDLTEKVGTLSRDVLDIKNRPAKRWESIVSTIITVLVTAALTYFLTKV